MTRRRPGSCRRRYRGDRRWAPRFSVSPRSGSFPRPRPARPPVSAIGSWSCGFRCATRARAPCQRVAIRLSLPSISPMPSQASIGELAPGGQRVVEIRLALPVSPRRSSGTDIPAGLLITFQKGVEEISVPGLLSLAIPDAESSADAADALLCGANPGDQLVAGLGDDLLSGAHDALPALAAILDSLGSLRAARARGA